MNMFRTLRNRSTERLSQRLLYILVSVATVVFGLFFLVGYDMPFEDNPDFNAPLFTDVLLLLMGLMLLLGVVLVVVSAVKSYRIRATEPSMVNGIPAKKITRIVWSSTFAVVILSFVLGSSSPMLVNGEQYADWFWLKVSDMFVTVALLMLLAAIGVVLFGVTRYVRKGKRA